MNAPVCASVLVSVNVFVYASVASMHTFACLLVRLCLCVSIFDCVRMCLRLSSRSDETHVKVIQYSTFGEMLYCLFVQKPKRIFPNALTDFPLSATGLILPFKVMATSKSIFRSRFQITETPIVSE